MLLYASLVLLGDHARGKYSGCRRVAAGLEACGGQVSIPGPLSTSGLTHRPQPALDSFAGVESRRSGMVASPPQNILQCLSELGGHGMTLLALVPLFAVLSMLIWRGGHKLSLALFTELPPAPLEQGGGFGNAIVGTLVMVGLATLVTLPIGILTAVFLAQHKEGPFCWPGQALRESANRIPVDPCRGVCLRSDRTDNRRLLRHRRSSRSFATHAAHDYPHFGKCNLDGPGQDDGSLYRVGSHHHADGLDGVAAHGNAWNSDGRHVGDGACRRARLRPCSSPRSSATTGW